jgi:hypothetical protein
MESGLVALMMLLDTIEQANWTGASVWKKNQA